MLAILFVVPLVALYFVVIRSVDRYMPEPWWLLFLCLVWGAVGAVIPLFYVILVMCLFLCSRALFLYVLFVHAITMQITAPLLPGREKN